MSGTATPTNSNEQAGEAVPANQRGSWTSFLKSIASFSGDLSSLTAPPFILSPTSLTEFPAYWCERPDLFASIAGHKGDEERFLAIVRWFIATLKGQYTSRNESMGSEKKPLNPVLGELFYGHWPDKNDRGRTTLVVEQVSHHPPITAYVIENKSKGLTLTGHNAQKTSFSSGAIIVKQIGHAILTIDLGGGKKEEVLITLPKLRIDGLWYGSPYIELWDKTNIQSSSGWSSVLEYKGKGYFSGKVHTVKATVSPPHSFSVKHTIEGQWHTETKNTKTGVVFTDVTTPKEEVIAGPVEEMEEFESRKLWGLVSQGIREGDYETASREKSKIENDQRQKRKDEAAAGTPWPLKHFNKLEFDPVYQRLASGTDITPQEEDCYAYQNNPPAWLS